MLCLDLGARRESKAYPSVKSIPRDLRTVGALLQKSLLTVPPAKCFGRARLQGVRDYNRLHIKDNLTCLLVLARITLIKICYIIPYITPFKEFRL